MSVSRQSKSNPFNTDANGYGSFYVVDGRYRIQATDIDWRDTDIFISPTFYAQLAGGPLANFTAMPQVGGDPVVESGSNADGEWTRWADGTQICTWEFTMSITGVIVNDTDWTFPAAFNASNTRPSVNWSPQKSNTYFIGGANSEIRNKTVAGHLENSNTDVRLRLYTIDGLTITTGGTIERNLVTAMGRWK